MRMIVTFEKGEGIRFIGHLDLMRTMQRALRRSGLPLSFSKGFNPHIRLSFAVPLSVGVVGLRELMDVPLSGEISPEDFSAGLKGVLPPPIQVKDCSLVPDDFPSLMSLVAGADYTIRMAEEDVARLAPFLEGFLAQEEITSERTTKSGTKDTDLKPFIRYASLGREGIAFGSAANANGMLKPSLFLQALCDFAQMECPPYVAYREAILSRNQKGELVPMEELTWVKR